METACTAVRCLRWLTPCPASSPPQWHGSAARSEPGHGCFVEVHLVRGYGVAYQGHRVNVHARLELYHPQIGSGASFSTLRSESGDLSPSSRNRRLADYGESTMRFWTKTPWWGEHFSLGLNCVHLGCVHVLSIFRCVIIQTSCAPCHKVRGRPFPLCLTLSLSHTPLSLYVYIYILYSELMIFR